MWSLNDADVPMSQKMCKIVFVRTSNFHQLWYFLAQRWPRRSNYVRCTHFPHHPIRVNALSC